MIATPSALFGDPPPLIDEPFATYEDYKNSFDRVIKTASFSGCRNYRFTLSRIWHRSNPRRLVVIGVNPSTATDTEDDPTIRRCVTLAIRELCGGYVMLNLFALRETNLKAMLQHPLPHGGSFPFWECVSCDNYEPIVVAAWGTEGKHRRRDLEVCEELERLKVPLWCLGITDKGFPRHPLYVKADATLIPFEPRMRWS